MRKKEEYADRHQKSRGTTNAKLKAAISPMGKLAPNVVPKEV